MAKQGHLITLEGGEGGGKTTLAVRLRERFKEREQEVVVLREPGSAAISEQIRKVLLSTENIGMTFTTEVLLFQAARAQTYQEIVLPSLKAGKVVIMDRSRDSSVVYQGIVRQFGRELIEQFNDISTKNTYPDLTILLDVSVKTGLQRRKASGKFDRLDLEAKEFHHQVRQAYLQLAKANDHDRWAIIDAEQPLSKVEEQVWQVIKQRLL
ncbi:MAG: dTMP kinase [Candidatus Pacebacteria bacterium]|nr:dTMP kinase [Candidatus Paceibacterota bacterium]